MHDASLAHVLERLAVIDHVVVAEVTRRRTLDPAVDEPFRGLYFRTDELDRLVAPSAPRPVRDDGAERLMTEAEAHADSAASSGADLRLRRLASSAALAPLDVELLLIALAPDLDARFERLYAYLHDDVTRRRASTGLALELCGVPATWQAARARLEPNGPLIAAGLVEVSDLDRPFLSRSLSVPDRVVAHLLGGDEPDRRLDALLEPPGLCLSGEPVALARAIRRGARLIYIRERDHSEGGGSGLAAAAFRDLGLDCLVLDVRRSAPKEDLGALARVALREARLRSAGLVIGPVEALLDRGEHVVRQFADLPWPLFMTGGRSWERDWSRDVPLELTVGGPTAQQRLELWEATLDGEAGGPGDVLESAIGTYKLGGDQIRRAAVAAELRAAYDGRPVDAGHLRAGARAQGVGGLERLAHRISPSAGWDDIVLPPAPLSLLTELSSRVRLRATVLERWGMKRGGRRGEGIAALFAGPSGTGKTLAAEVLAGDIGFDLYTVDLASVVDKYIGETEKNLDRVFNEAEQVNAVLFFDEADALFGKRSEVRDAHDRYANVEVAYLLQRMEAFDGIVILATNLRSNLDAAFARRLDAVVDFPMPDAAHRERIWHQALGREVPRAEELDIAYCAKAFELAGGNIRNIALAAAYLAAAEERPVATPDLIRGTEREFRKLGRLCVESDFGPYYSVISS